MTDEPAGVPEAARQRLADLRARGGSFFTSDLSVPEFLLVREAGFRPLTQVMGSCFYHVGWQWLPSGNWQGGWAAYPDSSVEELTTATEAWNEARGLALGRLAEEARLAGADAVVGVRIERGAYDWAQGLIEFVAVGTAVASDRYDLGEETVLSNLSGQEFAKLFAHGWWPVGLAAATTVCYVLSGWQTSQALSGLRGFQNQELTELTEGLYGARSQALAKIVRERHELGAEGVVGVRYDQHLEVREADRNGQKRTDLLVTLHVLGTAVARLARAGDEPPVYIALPLNEERRR